MSARDGVDVLAVLDRLLKTVQWERLPYGTENDLRVAADQIAELIAADREYDEAKALVYDLTRTDLVQCAADYERYNTAAARRAAALANVGASA